MNTANSRNKGPSATLLKIVMIYDDFGLAARAMASLERVAARVDKTMKLNIKLWKFEILKQPTLSAITVAVSMDADLIVLAMAKMELESDELLNWLKNWAEHRLIEDAAVLALFGNENSTPISFWTKLKRFAEGYGLCLLKRNDTWDGCRKTPFAWQRYQTQVIENKELGLFLKQPQVSYN